MMVEARYEEIKVQIQGKVEVIGKLDLYDKAMVAGFRKLISETADMIYSRARILAPFATGKLQNSLSVKYYGEGAAEFTGATVRATSKHGSYVEFGTGPMGYATQAYSPAYWKHKTDIKQAGMTPGEAGAGLNGLKLWLKRQGRDPRAAFVVARSIKRKGGLRARPFMMPAYDVDMKKFIDAAKKILSTDAPATAGMETGHATEAIAFT